VAQEGRAVTVRRIAWSLWVAAVAMTAAGIGFLALNGATETPNSLGAPVADGIFAVLVLSFATVGALVASRQPRNPIGWLFLVGGLAAALEEPLLGWATYALETDPESLPGSAAAALIADAVWLPSLASATMFMFLLFPTGRPPSPRWRPFLWVFALDMVVYVVGTLLNPGGLYFYPSIDNPIGVDAAGESLQTAVDFASPIVFVSLVVGLIALLLRFRRSSGVERAQLKWPVYTAAVFVALTPGLIVLGEREVELAGVLVSDLVFNVLICSVPVAVGVAILRHRLYDIDVVINRTLVYGALTGTLAAAYLGTVLLLQLAPSPLTEDSGLAIAGSTLAVAALFRPARSGIQAAVDRRFYRRRYDAARTLEGFGARLRDEIELDALSGELRTVVANTMQPAHVSLWLRESPR
jgi:hypothetical protein